MFLFVLAQNVLIGRTSSANMRFLRLPSDRGFMGIFTLIRWRGITKKAQRRSTSLWGRSLYFGLMKNLNEHIFED